MSAEERTEQTRRTILLAACETIAETGFEKVRMRMVAERAGVSTALLHYHFENREKLFLEALKFSYEHAGADGYAAEAPEHCPHSWRLARVIDASNELRPDPAVVSGDLISAYGDPLDTCIRQIARLRADSGIFGCLGNHERYAKAEVYTQQAAARAGIPFLRQSAHQLRFGSAALNLAGVDYQRWSSSRDYLPGAEKLVLPGACNILLSHNPDVFPVAAAQGYNLVLAGHTHGGQVAVEILDQSISLVRFVTPYVYGFFQSGAAAEYVTRGIGTIGIPTRIGAPPEISVLRLRKA